MKIFLTVTTLLLVAAVLSASIMYIILFVKVLAFLLVGVVVYSLWKKGKNLLNKIHRGVK